MKRPWGGFLLVCVPAWVHWAPFSWLRGPQVWLMEEDRLCCNLHHSTRICSCGYILSIAASSEQMHPYYSSPAGIWAAVMCFSCTGKWGIVLGLPWQTPLLSGDGHRHNLGFGSCLCHPGISLSFYPSCATSAVPALGLCYCHQMWFDQTWSVQKQLLFPVYFSFRFADIAIWIIAL